jgi:hypothetical protein
VRPDLTYRHVRFWNSMYFNEFEANTLIELRNIALGGMHELAKGRKQVPSQSGLRMNRDCSVLGIGSGVQTDTDQVFYFSAETETEPR